MSSGPKPPKPSPSEVALQNAQVAALQQQQSLLTEQLRRQDLLAPILYKQVGLLPQYDSEGRLSGFTQDTTPTPEQQAALRQQEILTEQSRISDLLQPYLYENAGLKPRYDESGRIQGFEKLPTEEKIDTLGDLRTSIEKQYLEREQAALAGNLPVDPGFIRQLDEGERNLRATLRQQLGPDYETSSPGIEALSNFNKRKVELTEAARRGDLSLAQQLGLGQQAAGQSARAFRADILGTLGNPALASAGSLQPIAGQGRSANTLANLLGAVQAPYSGTAGFGGANYGTLSQSLASQRRFEYEGALQADQRRAQTYQTIGGLLGGAAGAYFGPAGVTVGGALGSGLGYGASRF